MARKKHELVEPVAGFSEGEILDVTARFGDWHLYDVKLESESAESGSIELTTDELREVTEPVDSALDGKVYELVDSVEGLDEGEVLDVVARFGDWHVADVKLESRSSDGGSVELTATELREVAEPVDSSA